MTLVRRYVMALSQGEVMCLSRFLLTCPGQTGATAHEELMRHSQWNERKI